MFLMPVIIVFSFASLSLQPPRVAPQHKWERDVPALVQTPTPSSQHPELRKSLGADRSDRRVAAGLSTFPRPLSVRGPL